MAVIAGPLAAPAHADVAGRGGDYIALPTEGHLLDTRSAVGTTTKTPIAAGKTVTFSVLGVGGVPTSGVTGVLVDITGVSPTASTYLALGPSGTTDWAQSDVNLPAGSSPLSNSAVVQVGSDGKITAYNFAGTTQIVVDIQGYYTATTSSGGPGGLIPTAHTRVIDTRSGIGTPKAQIAAGKSLTVDLTTGGAIASGATSAYLDLIVVTPSNGGGYLGSYAAGGNTAAASVFDFKAGTTASGATVKIGTANKTVFVNHSAVAIDLVLTAEGYTAPVSTQGAGYRPARVRVLSGATVAPAGTVDVQVVGRGGVPTHGAAAVAVNVTAVSGTAGGYLKAYSADAAVPATSLDNFPASTSRGDFAILTPSANGTIRILNSSTTATRLYVDVQGWYATGASTAVATTPYSSVSVLQPTAGSGPVEGAYVRANGALMHGVIDPANLTSGTWTSVPSNLEAFSGQPSVTTLPAGKLLVAVLHANDGEVWTFTVADTTNIAAPVTWAPTFTRTGGIMAAAPVSANYNDGSAVTFDVDAAGQLWALPSTAGGYWHPVGANLALAGSPTVVTNSSANALQVVAHTKSGQVVTAAYSSAGVLGTWTDLAGVGVNDKVAALETYGPRLRVVARQSDGSVITKLQAVDGSFPATWTTIAGAGQTFIGAPAVGIDTATGSSSDPGTGDQFILARDSQDKHVYKSQELGEATDLFGSWTQADTGDVNPAATDPVVVPFGGGASQIHWIAGYLDSAAAPKLIYIGG